MKNQADTTAELAPAAPAGTARRPAQPHDVLPFVVFDSDLRRLESDAERGDATARATAGTALAWHLRERDTARAQALVRAARSTPTGRTARIAPATAVRLALVESEIHWLNARMDESRRGVEDALRDAERLHDDVLAADAHWLRANLANDLGDIALRDQSFTLCAARARAAGDRQREMIAQGASARWSVFTDPVAAREVWLPRLGLEDAEALPPGVTTWRHDFRATLAFLEADFGKSLVYRLRMHNDALATGQWMRVLSARVNISGAFSNLNDYDAAFEWSERYLGEARRRGWPLCVAYGLTQMGSDLASMHLYDAARTVLLEAVGMPALSGASRRRAIALGYLALCFEHLEEPARAFELYGEMEATAAALGQSDLVFNAQEGGGRVTAALGQLDKAIALNSATLQACRRDGRPRQQIELLRSLSGLHGRRRDEGTGDVAADGRAALDCVEQALAISRAIEGCEVAEDLYVRLAEEQARAGDYPAAYASGLLAARAREKTLTREAVNRSVAMQISHDTERARAEAEHHRALTATLQRTNETLQRLGDFGREITRHLDEGAVFDVLHRHVEGLLDAQHLSIFLLADDAGAAAGGPPSGLSLAYGREGGAAIGQPIAIALDDPASGVARCAREGREIVWERDASPADDGRHVAGTLRTASALYAPLEIGGRRLGVMTVQAVREHAYGEREQLVFRTLCAYGAIGLNNAQAYRRLAETSQALQAARDGLARTNAELERAYLQQQEASLTDPLSGLRNRRFLTERMTEDVALAQRRAAGRGREGAAAQDVKGIQALVFFMIDVDHFKSVNDEHGHAAGDQVLVRLAQRLREVVRESDYLVRWGGEEFLVVARESMPSLGGVLAERLRLAAASQPFDIGGGVFLRRTCSVGFAAYPFERDERRLANWAAMVELADQALYRAKNGGRDRWVGFYANDVAPSRERFEQLARDPLAALADGTLTLLQGPGIADIAAIAVDEAAMLASSN